MVVEAQWGTGRAVLGSRGTAQARLRLPQVLIDRGGRPSALVDGPHDEGLASPAVARGEDPLDRGLVVLGAGLVRVSVRVRVRVGLG